MMTESYLSLLQTLSSHVENGSCGREIAELLLPNGQALDSEDSLWDYKATWAATSNQPKTPEDKKKYFDYQLGRTVKTIVSFYNSYGGYILYGIDNKSRKIIGFSQEIDTDELKKRLESYAGAYINIFFNRIVLSWNNISKEVGILYIPRRPDGKDPVKFVRHGPTSPTGDRAFSKGDLYLRAGHECRLAKDLEDYRFLLYDNKRQYLRPSDVSYSTVLDHNYIFRDKTISKIIPRDDYIGALWQWLLDPVNTVRVLVGFGGVGKTTIAAIFARDVLRVAPKGFEKVIWLSAKVEHFRPLDGGRVVPSEAAEKPRFSDTSSLLTTLLEELGYLEEDIDADWNLEELSEEVISALSITPSFIVIDDVDTLPSDEQYELFQTIVGIFGRTQVMARNSSRALLTSRKTLGAARTQMIRVRGFELEPFCEYVDQLCKQEGLAFRPDRETKVMARFHRVSDGSPLFAAAIVSLVANNESPSVAVAVEKWKDTDGEDVRAFAFERELSQLNDSELRTLYTAIILGDTSLPELQHVTGSSSKLLSDDLTELRKYHLLAFSSGASGNDEGYTVPKSLVLMRDLVQSKVHNPKAIERACQNIRSEGNRFGIEAGRIIYQVVSQWKNGATIDALATAEWGDKRAKGKHPDLKCILGRANLRVEPPNARAADVAFRHAYDLHCSRDELFPLWFETKKILGDWQGLVEISRLADKVQPSSENVYERALALRELSKISADAGDLHGAASRCNEAIREISEAFAERRARGRVSDLQSLRVDLCISRVEFLDVALQDPNKKLEVWHASLDALANRCPKSFLLQRGLAALQTWWEFSDSIRDSPHPHTAERMHVELGHLDDLRQELGNIDWPDTALAARIKELEGRFRERLAAYEERLATGA